jgi:hypothetical protein
METMAHDCKPSGATTLFTCLESRRGQVIGPCYHRNRHQELLNFLRNLDKVFPGKIRLHLILNNSGTDKQCKVRDGLKRHTCFVLHLVPTSSSWRRSIERCLGKLGAKATRRSRFHSVNDLNSAIDGNQTAWNNDPKPFL